MSEVSPTSRWWNMKSVGDVYMSCYSLPDPNDEQTWFDGARLSSLELPQPLAVRIRAGHEALPPIEFLTSPPIMSDRIHAALLGLGVDNLEVYEAVLRSADGQVQLTGYKVYNLIGMVSAADLAKTRFAANNPSRHIDASIEELSLDSAKIADMRMFRMSQFAVAVWVDEAIKLALEAMQIPNLGFRAPADFATP